MLAVYEINNVPGNISFETGDEIKAVLQRCKNLLCCHVGEVPYDQSRGYDRAMNDLPVSVLKEKLLPEIDRLLMWEPYAEAVSASIQINTNGEALITVKVKIEE